jgi:hypothetical protein
MAKDDKGRQRRQGVLVVVLREVGSRAMWPRLGEPRFSSLGEARPQMIEAAEGAETAEVAKWFLLAVSWSAHGSLDIRAHRREGRESCARAPMAVSRKRLEWMDG